MFCSKCGTAAAAGGRFCAACGEPMGVAAPGIAPVGYAMQPVRPRVERHLKALGILWLVLGAYRILGLLIAIPIMAGIFGVWGHGWGHGMAMHGSMDGMSFPFSHPWMASLLPVITLFVLVMVGFSFLVGYGLLTARPWGRVLAIIAAALTLLKFPFGTALAIYTLWVLLPSASAAEYDRIAV